MFPRAEWRTSRSLVLHLFLLSLWFSLEVTIRKCGAGQEMDIQGQPCAPMWGVGVWPPDPGDATCPLSCLEAGSPGPLCVRRGQLGVEEGAKVQGGL